MPCRSSSYTFQSSIRSNIWLPIRDNLDGVQPDLPIVVIIGRLVILVILFALSIFPITGWISIHVTLGGLVCMAIRAIIAFPVVLVILRLQVVVVTRSSLLRVICQGLGLGRPDRNANRGM